MVNYFIEISHRNSIETWRKSLSEMKLPNKILSTSNINDTFHGNGYFLKFITNNFKNTLVLATEMAKVYCDEYDYIIYPEVVEAINQDLLKRLPKHADAFYKMYS